MKTAVPLTVVWFVGALLALGCVADDTLATTPVVPPTATRPAGIVPTPDLTPFLPPRPAPPAAGTYFGQVIAVDAPGTNVTFSPVCLGADRKVMRPLAANEMAPRVIPLLSTTEVLVFVSPPNNPAAGRMTPVDLNGLAEALRTNPAAKYFLTVEPQGVKQVEMDSGVRPSPAPDDPCPHF
jgi:hypothetical protein